MDQLRQPRPPQAARGNCLKYHVRGPVIKEFWDRLSARVRLVVEAQLRLLPPHMQCAGQLGAQYLDVACVRRDVLHPAAGDPQQGAACSVRRQLMLCSCLA